MRSAWNQLRLDCQQQLRLQSTIAAYQGARQHSAALACFPAPEEVLAGLAEIQNAEPPRDWARHNAILTDVIRAARTPDGREWGFCVLWLQLEPGLSASRWGLTRYGVDDAAATSFLSHRLAHWIKRFDLNRQRAIAHDLLGDIARDSHDEIRRNIRRQRRLTYVSDLNHSGLPRVVQPTEAGSDPYVAEVRIGQIRDWLVEVLGAKDADLVVAVDILGQPIRDAAARLGLSYDVARKRIQRARRRLADSLDRNLVPNAEWASRFHGGKDNDPAKERP